MKRSRAVRIWPLSSACRDKQPHNLPRRAFPRRHQVPERASSGPVGLRRNPEIFKTLRPRLPAAVSLSLRTEKIRPSVMTLSITDRHDRHSPLSETLPHPSLQPSHRRQLFRLILVTLPGLYQVLQSSSRCLYPGVEAFECTPSHTFYGGGHHPACPLCSGEPGETSPRHSLRTNPCNSDYPPGRSM